MINLGCLILGCFHFCYFKKSYLKKIKASCKSLWLNQLYIPFLIFSKKLKWSVIFWVSLVSRFLIYLLLVSSLQSFFCMLFRIGKYSYTANFIYFSLILPSLGLCNKKNYKNFNNMKIKNFCVIAFVPCLFKRTKLAFKELSKWGASSLFLIQLTSLVCCSLSFRIILFKEYILATRFCLLIKVGANLPLATVALDFFQTKIRSINIYMFLRNFINFYN